MRRAGKTALFVIVIAWLALPAAAETFLDSEEYEDREGGAIGRFLHDDDYRLMEEDLERNDVSIDWAWFKPAEMVAPQLAAAAVGGRLHRLAGRLRSIRPQRSHELGFDLAAAHIVFVAPVENHAGLMKPDLLEEIQQALVEAAGALGLQVAANRESANLALEVAVVDQMRSGVTVPVYGIHVEPFLSFELRLVDLKSGEKLLLVRNRKHGGTLGEAAFNFADDLVMFLR
jgi:hypothetical protein